MMDKITFRTKYIVISDFRALPVMAALHLADNSDDAVSIVFIVSRRFLRSNDYGQYLPISYKKIKLWWLSFFYELLYVPCSDATLLLDEELIGIRSSLKSITCDSCASERSYPILYKQLLDQALGAKEVAEYLRAIKTPSKIYLFNGRTAASQAIVKICYNCNISLDYYEYADAPYSGYRLYPHAPHNTVKIGENLCSFRNYVLRSVPDIFILGKTWSDNKLSNPFTNSYSIESVAKYDVVIFLGSDHEYTDIDEDTSGFNVIGNLALVETVIAKYGSNKNMAVRAHPNQRSDVNFEITLKPVVDLCKQHNLTFYGPDSGVSSYDLIKSSSVVAVEYSSIAYDAVMLGAEVDIFSNLDLKIIIDRAPAHIRMDSGCLKAYVREILSLHGDLFFVRFNPLKALAARVLSFFEFRVLRCAKPPPSIVKRIS